MTRRDASNYRAVVSTTEAREKDGETYGNGGGLRDEANEVEFQLSLRCKSNTRRDHEHDDGKLLARLLQTEGPRNEQNCYWSKRLSPQMRNFVRTEAKMNAP